MNLTCSHVPVHENRGKSIDTVDGYAVLRSREMEERTKIRRRLRVRGVSTGRLTPKQVATQRLAIEAHDLVV